MEVGGGHSSVEAWTGAAAMGIAWTDGATLAFTLDRVCLTSVIWWTLKPSYLFERVLLRTAVVSRGTLTVCEAATLNEEEVPTVEEHY